MNDIEERLRAGLHELAEPVDAHVDADAALAGGARLRRGRAARWASAGVALATVVAVVAWNGVARQPIAGVPAPEPTTRSTQATSSEVGLEFAQADPPREYTGVNVAVVRTGQRLAVEVARTRANGDEGVTHSFTTDAGRYWSVAVDGDLVIALIPGQVVAVAGLPGWEVVYNDALGLDLMAVAAQRTDPAFGDLRGLVWLAANSVVRDSGGAVVPSAGLRVGDRSVVVFRDERLQAWGYFDEYNDDRAALPLATEPVDTVREVNSNPEGEVTEIGFLPAGGRDPKLTVRKGATWGSAAVGDSGRVAYIVFAVNPGSTPLVTSVTYTDASGNRATYRP
jgi:hypothetical protein